MTTKLKRALIYFVLTISLAAPGFGLPNNDDLESRPEGPQNPRARPPIRMARPYVSTGPVGYSPAQIRHAYAIDQIVNQGAGQTIGIVVAYGSPTLQKDLDVFCKQYSLPFLTVQTIYGKNKPSSVNVSWALETSLDVQWAHAIAPKAKIIVSIAATSTNSNLLAAVDNAVKAGAKIISMSWGGSEFSTETAYETYFNRTGVSYFAATGDDGTSGGTSWPAVSPSVTAVGGTTLHLDGSGDLTAAEVAWSGSGGGFSLYFKCPAYQVGWTSSSQRAYPDIAMVADPLTGVAVYNSTPAAGNPGWRSIGGTSASCPIAAASFALVNEQRLAKGRRGFSGYNSSLYQLADRKSAAGLAFYPFYFYDVTAGNNGGFSATPLFDQTTGFGSPNYENIISVLSSF